jgi:hypothetical protein
MHCNGCLPVGAGEARKLGMVLPLPVGRQLSQPVIDLRGRLVRRMSTAESE